MGPGAGTVVLGPGVTAIMSPSASSPHAMISVLASAIAKLRARRAATELRGVGWELWIAAIGDRWGWLDAVMEPSGPPEGGCELTGAGSVFERPRRSESEMECPQHGLRAVAR
jgi:hypothetical protein